MGSFRHPQWHGWNYHGAAHGYAQLPSYAAYLPESMELYNTHQSHLLHHQHMSRSTETKSRLSKEEVEVLEAEFQKNHKPNSSIKKALAEQMRVDNARINNWFQNRRAREKKENNIREYAAKQKQHKQHITDDAIELHDDGHIDHDRVVSSAPFPEPRPGKSRAIESISSDLTTPDRESESSETSQSDRASELSPILTVQATPDPIPESVSVDFGSLAESTFNQYPQLIIPKEESTPSPTSLQCYPSTDRLSTSPIQGQYLSSYDEPQYLNDFGIELSSQSSTVPIKSPPSMDIASRRNRRPPHLALVSSRSYSASAPKVGMDMNRRVEIGNSMRRVASATGTVRICKPSGTPRSPYFERNSEALLQLNRSPSFATATAAIAPPTPNTPIVTNTQQRLCEPTPASTVGINDKYSVDLGMSDPTLRTPPTTPGLMENMFNIDSAYNMAVSDEPLITPGLGGFPTGFEVPVMSSNIPNYISSGCSSQPHTPSFAPQMGPAYFGYAGGNAEYNWSDQDSLSAHSSPAQSQRNMHFMNMTPSSFTPLDQ